MSTLGGRVSRPRLPALAGRDRPEWPGKEPKIVAIDTTEIAAISDCNHINHSTDDLLPAIMARLIRVESMVCSLSILALKHMAGDNLSEYQALSRWLGAVRAKIVETSLKSHAEQFPELSRFIEEHVELSERDLMKMFQGRAE